MPDFGTRIGKDFNTKRKGEKVWDVILKYNSQILIHPINLLFISFTQNRKNEFTSFFRESITMQMVVLISEADKMIHQKCQACIHYKQGA